MGGFLFFFRAAVARSSFPRLDYAICFCATKKAMGAKIEQAATIWLRPQERPGGMSQCESGFATQRQKDFICIPGISEGHGFGMA